MLLLSWNVNGIRAVEKKGALAPLFDQGPDILILQETKATPDQFPEHLRSPKQYFSYFTHPSEKKGYSGVVMYSRIEPQEVHYGFGIPSLDTEGRLITLVFECYIVAGCYFPNGGGGPERMDYKLRFYDAFLEYVDTFRARGIPIIFAGDINAAHEPIDLARPEENEGTPGYNPYVRAWLDEVTRHGYVDTFRTLHPHSIEYSYWDMKTRARERNVGWRIDYVFASRDLLPYLKNSFIQSDVYGSDHCPVGAIFSM